jgi:hypothetical protein
VQEAARGISGNRRAGAQHRSCGSGTSAHSLSVTRPERETSLGIL